MEPLRLADQGDLAELVCEFLEVCIHQLLCVRELYPPAIFERRRHFNVPVQWARHPDLREYIHSAVASLEPWIQQVRLLSLTRGMDLCFGGSPPADGWSGGHGCRAPWRRSRCCLWTATKSQWRRSCSSYASSRCPGQQDTSSSLSAASSSSSASVLRSYRLCHQTVRGSSLRTPSRSLLLTRASSGYQPTTAEVGARAPRSPPSSQCAAAAWTCSCTLSTLSRRPSEHAWLL